MIDNLTFSDIANEVSMMRSSHRGAIIVVEGVTDARLYGKFIDRDEVSVVIAYSKENVKRSVAELYRRKDRRTLGIIDPDLDRLFGKSYDPPLFMTDKRDLETMILSTDALDDVLTEYSDPAALERFETEHGDVSDALARASYPIGLLMYVSSRDSLGLCFKDMDYLAFVDTKSLRTDMRKMVKEVLSLSAYNGTGRNGLIDSVNAEEEVLDDPWIAARGHDAVSILLIGFHHAFGSYNSRSMTPGQLSGALRLAFSYEDFVKTDVYKRTSEWSSEKGIALWITQ